MALSSALRALPSHESPIALQTIQCSVQSLWLMLTALQGEDPDYSWAITVMLFYLKLLLAVVSAVLSICWLLQVVLYMFTNPPITPFLNTFFITLDNVFPLFGTVAFAVFCFYLIGERSARMIASAAP